MKNLETELQVKYDSAKSFYKKAFVIYDGKGKISLKSYDTIVCVVNEPKRTIEVTGYYSQTTSRQIKEFLKQLGLFQYLKKDDLKGCKIKY